MQGFIDKQYYVVCLSHKEIVDFLNLCREYNLKFTDRLTFGFEDKPWIDEAVFAFDYDHASPGDGVSYWSNQPYGDGRRPHKHLSEIDQSPPGSQTDADDFLTLL